MSTAPSWKVCSDDYHPLQRNFLWEEFHSQARSAGLTKAVHIEAAFGCDPVRETAFVRSVADHCGIPHLSWRSPPPKYGIFGRIKLTALLAIVITSSTHY